MEKSLEKMIEDTKITKTVSKSNDIKITSEHEVCGSHTKYVDG